MSTTEPVNTSELDGNRRPSRRRRVAIVIAGLAVVTVAALGIGRLGNSPSAADGSAPVTASVKPTISVKASPSASSSPSVATSASGSASSTPTSAATSATPSASSATPSPSASSKTPAASAPASAAANPAKVASTVEPEPAAKALVPAVVKGNSQLMKGDAVDLSSIAQGAVLEEMNSAAAEAKLNGVEQEGEPSVVSVTVTKSRMDATPRSFDIAVCLDSSNVKVLAKGVDQIDPTAPRRSINLYTVEERGGAWLLTTHSFPADPDC